jgi:tetratricopeptide (TPR) repeat protein
MRVPRSIQTLIIMTIPFLALDPSGVALAQQAVDSADEARAKQLYREGEVHYAAGRYKMAAVKFEQAYAITKQPALLFNLGNAYERMGDFAKAAARLRLYLSSPNAKGKQLVSERIGRLEAAHEAQMRERSDLAKARLEAERTGDKAPPMSAKQPAEGPSNVLAYVFLGVGAAALGTSLGLGLAANSAGDDADPFCSGSICQVEAEDSIDKQKGLALGADIMLGVGLASAAVGTFLLVRNLLSDERPSETASSSTPLWVHAAVQPQGAAVGVGGHF